MDAASTNELLAAKKRLREQTEAEVAIERGVVGVGDGSGRTWHGGPPANDLMWVRPGAGFEADGVTPTTPHLARNLSLHEFVEGDPVTLEWMHSGRGANMLQIVYREQIIGDQAIYYLTYTGSAPPVEYKFYRLLPGVPVPEDMGYFDTTGYAFEERLPISPPLWGSSQGVFWLFHVSGVKAWRPSVGWAAVTTFPALSLDPTATSPGGGVVQTSLGARRIVIWVSAALGKRFLALYRLTASLTWTETLLQEIFASGPTAYTFIQYPWAMFDSLGLTEYLYFVTSGDDLVRLRLPAAGAEPLIDPNTPGANLTPLTVPSGWDEGIAETLTLKVVVDSDRLSAFLLRGGTDASFWVGADPGPDDTPSVIWQVRDDAAFTTGMPADQTSLNLGQDPAALAYSDPGHTIDEIDAAEYGAAALHGQVFAVTEADESVDPDPGHTAVVVYGVQNQGSLFSGGPENWISSFIPDSGQADAVWRLSMYTPSLDAPSPMISFALNRSDSIDEGANIRHNGEFIITDVRAANPFIYFGAGRRAPNDPIHTDPAGQDPDDEYVFTNPGDLLGGGLYRMAGGTYEAVHAINNGGVLLIHISDQEV